MKQTNNIELWLSRDQDGTLILWEDKPRLYVDVNTDFPTEEWYFGGEHWMLDPKLYPEVTFSNSPMKVELRIVERI